MLQIMCKIGHLVVPLKRGGCSDLESSKVNPACKFITPSSNGNVNNKKEKKGGFKNLITN
jgi:hypothetical protein